MLLYLLEFSFLRSSVNVSLVMVNDKMKYESSGKRNKNHCLSEMNEIYNSSTAGMGPTSSFNCWIRLNTLLDSAG